MKILICLVMALAPLCAAKKVRNWEQAKVESCFEQVLYGSRYVRYDPSMAGYTGSVHESIYINAGDWLYHVSREVGRHAILRLEDGARIEVAVEGKTLLIRVGGKQYSARIEQKLRAGAAVGPLPSRR